jgi:hypothetical protein
MLRAMHFTGTRSLRRLSVVTAVFAGLVATAACAPGPATVCNLSTTLPTAEESPVGRLVAKRSGVSSDPFSEAGAWTPGPSTSIDAGLLSLIIAQEQTGTRTEDLIANAAFPICVPLADRSDRSGQANFVDGGFVTSASHTGGVAILAVEDGNLVGRFEAELANNQGQTLTFSDGVFRLPQH